MPDAATWTAIVPIAFGSSVLGTLAGKLLDRTGARAELIRDGYADAIKALNAWGHYPERIYRRVDDSPETLLRLETMGADLKAALAYSTGWVSGESAELGRVYSALVELLRAEVTIHARLAWARPPASKAAAMNIGEPPSAQALPNEGDGATPAEWLIVQQFSTLIQYRVGWRRVVWIRPLLRRRLDKLQVIGHARKAFSERSARMLNGDWQSAP
ncbi:hypothetical protein E1263_21445 [Kribbella antibiotica]|uniref:Uncharacterized protein n=2 Tax=Kribbella antibiotica TaxID=190195 RepID=A0A4R4ZIJ2_9ACTN|nr:hypothetical protein E1263_21445 [Kribbella antibiotica]